MSKESETLALLEQVQSPAGATFQFLGSSFWSHNN